MKYLITVCFQFFAFIQGLQIPCKDENGNLVTSCQRCLWQPSCVWCSDRSFGSNKPAVGCIEQRNASCDSFVDPPIEMRIIKSQSLKWTLKDSIQISPQSLILKLRPNTPATIEFMALLADSPVDIYFVMDLSKSMNTSRSNLIEASESIANKISKLTYNYTLGFGSFSDKMTPPFAMIGPQYDIFSLSHPYSFRHEMKLERSAKEFQNRVRGAYLSKNVDSPESGFDALMQSLLCTDLIGWRDDSVQKVIIFISDLDFHYALDGQLGGIYERNDQQCHTQKVPQTSYFEYLDHLNYDYPSLGQLRHVLKQKNMVIIFGIESFMVQLYRDVSLFLQGIDTVGQLTNDPSSIEDLVIEQYKNVKSRLVLNVENTDFMKLNWLSNCSRIVDGNHLICYDVHSGDIIHYTMNITLQEEYCNTDRDNLIILLVGFPQAILTLDISCQSCKCEDFEKNSLICHSNGNLVCGGCECNEGFVGKSCECNVKDLETSNTHIIDFEKECQASWSHQLCEGRGGCLCGDCVCFDYSMFHGKYCHCSIHDCPGWDDKNICSSHGDCRCGAEYNSPAYCTCHTGYMGENCECPTNDENCKDVLTKSVCFERGSCHCGSCDCKLGYVGKYCQEDSTFLTCEKLEPCVKLSLFTENITESELNEWKSECDEYKLNQLYSTIETGCRLYSNGTRNGIVLIGDTEDCDLIYTEYNQIEESDDTPLRGDIRQDVVRARELKTDSLKQCSFYHNGCYAFFYHNRLESDDIFDKERNGMVVVIFEQQRDLSWNPLVQCGLPISLPIVLGSSIGALLLLGLILLTVVMILINIRDKRRWQQFEARKASNIAKLGELSNPLYKSRATTFQNPTFGK